MKNIHIKVGFVELGFKDKFNLFIRTLGIIFSSIIPHSQPKFSSDYLNIGCIAKIFGFYYLLMLNTLSYLND